MLITVHPGSASPATYPLGPGHMLIGRDPACEIRLTDRQASRRHACIHRLGARFEIEDLQSGQGTVVNGRLISRHQLQDGDRIQVGQTELAVVTAGHRPAPETAEPPQDLHHELSNPLLVIQLSHQSLLDQFDASTIRDQDRAVLDELMANMQYGIDQLKEIVHTLRPSR